MTESKRISEKDKAHQLFKRWKAGMELESEEIALVKKYYPAMR